MIYQFERGGKANTVFLYKNKGEGPFLKNKLQCSKNASSADVVADIM